MIKVAHTLAALAVLSIAACTAPQLAAISTRSALSPGAVSTLTGICRQGEQLIAIAGNPAMPAQVKEIGGFVGAYCGQLLAGSVPTTTDLNTTGWLEQNLGTLRGLLFRP